MWQKFKNIYHFFIAVLANIFYLFPGRKLIVVGVTGTDGKTTTTYLIYHILKSSGKNVSMVSTLGSMIGKNLMPIGLHVTTPDSFAIQKLLRMAVKAKSEYFVLEVTSHALDQNRVVGIPFKIAVLTNLTSEHLDYHKTFDNYLKAKEKLLKMAEIAVVNKDDAAYSILSESKNLKSANKWTTYGFFEESDVNLDNFKIGNIKIIGEFNKYNILAAATACKELGIEDEEIKKALLTFKLPKGRLEYVYRGDFAVMIDFAHTPNAFEQLLKSIRPLVKGRLIHVFGSAGERDAQKRPYMGEISAGFSDIVVLTAEDPRGEKIDDITEDIMSGINTQKAQILKIPDRREAITVAIQMAKKNDFVLITGKAHEASMNMGNGEEPWDEYKIVKDILFENKNII